MAIPDMEIIGVGSLRGQGRCRGRRLHHHVGRYGLCLPIWLFRHLCCTTYGIATGRC